MQTLADASETIHQHGNLQAHASDNDYVERLNANRANYFEEEREEEEEEEKLIISQSDDDYYDNNEDEKTN